MLGRWAQILILVVQTVETTRQVHLHGVVVNMDLAKIRKNYKFVLDLPILLDGGSTKG